MYTREEELEKVDVREVLNRVKKLEEDVNLLRNIIFTHVAPRPGITMNQLQSNHQMPFQNRVVVNRNSVAVTNMVSTNNHDTNNLRPHMRQPCTVSTNPFQMKSFVHPTTAVPPGINRPLFGDPGGNNAGVFNNIYNSTSTADQNNHMNASPLSVVQPLHRSKWSTIPADKSLLDNLTNSVNITDPTESVIEINLPYKKHDRQSFVEVLTCFCPCFSMC